MRPVSAGTSNTSCTHSRTVSRTIGKVPYRAATASRCADRCRCCQSGERRPGWRRGSSSARAAHSRNRDANSADAAQLGGDQRLQLVRVELGDAGRRRLVGVGHAQHDPVVGVQRLDVHVLVALAQPGGDGQRPRGMHPGPVRAVQDQPPVPELVPEPLHHQRPVIGQVAGGFPLRYEVTDQVRRRQLVQASAAQLRGGRLLARLAEFAAERAERAAELGRPAGCVAVPERQPAGLARGGGDEHLVGGDVLDPPRAGAEHEHVTDPRLVHHLLVELTDPVGVAALALRPGQEHAEQAAVGDGAAAGDGEPLRARPAVQGVGGAVPDQPGPQLGELLAGVAAGQHVEHGLQHRPGEATERRRPADHLLQRADFPVVHRDHGDDLLGEDVERVARDAQFLDRPVPHPLGDHRRLHQVALVFREEHAAGDIADVVAGPAGALQAARHRRRRLDLDDQVHRAHVDAEFQAGGGDHGRQAARFQRLLDLLPLLPGHRAVVGPGDLRPVRRPRCLTGHDLRRHGRGQRRGRQPSIRRSSSPAAARPRARSAGRTAVRPVGGSWRRQWWTGAAR